MLPQHKITAVEWSLLMDGLSHSVRAYNGAEQERIDIEEETGEPCFLVPEFRQRLHHKARKHGKHVKTRFNKEENKMYFRFY